MYWAQELAAQTEDAELAQQFAPLAKTLTAQEKTIVAEFAAVQGKPVDIGGYYFPSQEKLQSIMCPSKTFNEALKTV
jgi:isocitrate dehydrogenase